MYPISEKFTTGATYHQYLQDKKLRLAVERAVEIIGEAATKVSRKFRDAHPESPWPMIINQRRIIVHEYGELEDDLLANLNNVQKTHGVEPDSALVFIEKLIETAAGQKKARFPNFSIEMETGAGNL